jgi:hypothetical protein
MGIHEKVGRLLPKPFEAEPEPALPPVEAGKKMDLWFSPISE